MPSYLILHAAATSKASDDLGAMMRGAGAVPIGDCLWGLEVDLDEQNLWEWLESELHVGDSVTVIELRPNPGQISPKHSVEAMSWLARTLYRKAH
ncbi:hypothetical protein SAMN04488523_105307 [Sulfitobacter brevis]|uniref:Divalent cation tolerance protein n=1 Tax=Sulfitobacter brevis TaxID=74348 RepID=A0A1I1YLT8_9RHOB|nr:hypothetical protein SAMN04488523_105307 [Sulfitobacter brevis]